MEYQELIGVISDETRYTRREIRKILRILARLIREMVAAGRDVQIRGLGRFKNIPAAARKGRHPVTGEIIPIPARRRMKFHPCEDLMQALEQSRLVFDAEKLERRYGLEQADKDQAEEAEAQPVTRSASILRGERHGKVRRRDRPEPGPQGKEGGGGR